VKLSNIMKLFARPGNGNIRTRRVAILVADGIDVTGAQAIHTALLSEGAVPRFVGPKLGTIRGGNGADLEVEMSLATGPSMVFDALALPDGEAAAKALASVGQALDLIKDTYRHSKPILAVGAAKQLLDAAQLPAALADGNPDPGLLVVAAPDKDMRPFITAIARHRHDEQRTEPPRT
jgi:catalase